MSTAIAQNLLFTEHILWIKNLDQVKIEFKELQSRLEKALPNFQSQPILARVEQFQNRFIRQREVVDELRHEIKQHENHLERLDEPTHVLLMNHVTLRAQYNRFYELFIEMERDFDEFLA